jgi:hypothetical protein
MSTKTWEQILEELRVPFSPEIVAWKPQAVSRDRRRCMAVAYAETQPYQERLDQVCPDWQDDYAIWFSDPQDTVGRAGEKKIIPGKVFVKCRLSIAEHTRADVGECQLTDENALTTAKAQAFKRACAAFGLGRYLYDLPRAWVDYDEDKGILGGEMKKLEMLLRRQANGNGSSSNQTGGQGPEGPPPGQPGASHEPDAALSQPEPAARRPRAEANGKQRQAKNQPGKPSEPAGEAEGQNPAQDKAEPEGSTHSQDDEQSICPIHNAPLRLVITRDGKTLLLHRIEGEGYCNGEVVKPPLKA